MVNVVSCYRRAEAQQIHFTSYRPFSSLSKCTFIHFWSFLLLPTPLHFLYISRASLVHPKALNRTFTTRVKTWLCAETCVYTRTQEVLKCQHCSATRKKFLSSLGTRFDHRNSTSSGSVVVRNERFCRLVLQHSVPQSPAESTTSTPGPHKDLMYSDVPCKRCSLC